MLSVLCLFVTMSYYVRIPDDGEPNKSHCVSALQQRGKIRRVQIKPVEKEGSDRIVASSQRL